MNDLTEEVAKAMLRALGWTDPQIEYARKHRSSAWLDTMSQARAATAVIIEACAGYHDAEIQKYEHILDKQREEGVAWASRCPEKIGEHREYAAAIRALAAKPEGRS